MKDKEINEAVARKLGFIICDGKRTTERALSAWNDNEQLQRFDPPWTPIPDYCHSIAAAWEVISAVDYFSVSKNIAMGKAGVTIIDVCLWKDDQFVASDADTAPMAICLAFLKMP